VWFLYIYRLRLYALWCLTPLSTIFQLYRGGQLKPPTCRKSVTPVYILFWLENKRNIVQHRKIEMPFLDVLIRISTNNNIITDIFSKDTDIHMYLNFRSSHPKHIKINIPFNLASRIITITNTEELRDTGLRELKIVFEKSTISGGNS
jgi:hypothetical protein